MANWFREIARSNKLTLHEGIYAGLKGPSLETSAERRMLAVIGADTVGMSTVNEIIMARYLDLDTSAFCTITNMAIGDSNQQPDDIEQIMKYAQLGGAQLVQLISAYCKTRA
jgi:purine-nucleoside phosphorylase